MCVDLARLNRFVRQERYQSATPAQAVANIAVENAKIFTKFDALKGYHQCPRNEESQLLTTFITPFGRIEYLRASHGDSPFRSIISAEWTEAFNGLTGYSCIIDDVDIYDSDTSQHPSRLTVLAMMCRMTAHAEY